MDFIAQWNGMHATSCRQKQQLGDSQEKYWAGSANVQQFAQHQQQELSGRVKWELASLPFEAGSTVLDIGAGPGTLAVPLAKRGVQVTALEPSAPMLEALEAYRRAEDAPAVAAIQSTFEDAENLGVYDYVLSSFSFMHGDLKAVLEKMNAAAAKEVHIFWFLTSPAKSRGNEDLWPLIHGEPYAGEPTADIIFGALHQLGIRANMTTFGYTSKKGYANLEAACEEYGRRMLATTAEQTEIIRKYVIEHAVQVPEGFIMPAQHETAHLWWKRI